MRAEACYTAALAFSASLSPSEPIEPFQQKDSLPPTVIPKRE